MIDLTSKITQAQFGELVGISQPAVSDLLSRGVISPDATAVTWLREYAAHLREIAAGRMASGDLDLAAERARLAKEQADKIAMQNAERRGELAPAYLIEEVLSLAGSRASRIFESIVPTIKRREPGLSAETLRVIESDIAKIRNLAASVSLAQLRSGQDGETDDVDEAAA